MKITTSSPEDDSAAIGKIQKNAAEIAANASQPTAGRVAR